MATRKTIREAVKTLIEGGFNLVLPFDSSSVDQRDFPMACVFIEEGETEEIHGGGFESNAQLIIEIWAASAENIDSALDDLATPVNTLIDDNPTLSGLVQDVMRSGYSYDRDPESFTGALTLTFKISYEDED